MRQRVMIAMALPCDPRPADRRRADHGARRHGAGADPRPAARAAARTGLAIILITHDLGIVARDGRRGRGDVCGPGGRARAGARRSSTTRSIPTRCGLLGSIPKIERAAATGCWRSTAPCPAPFALPQAARFHPRCVFADATCAVQDPRCACSATNHRAACIRAPVRSGRDRHERRCSKSRDLARHFRVERRSGARRKTVGVVRAVDGISFTHDRGRDAGARRRVRLRQIDHRAACAAADRPDRRARSGSRAATSPICDRRPLRSCAGGCRSYSRIRSPRSIRA